MLDLARMADAEGWHCLWYADHYMPNTGGEDVLPGDVHECWAMLPAIAAVTERLRIGSLVAPTSIHHPAMLANRAATIDHISDGRLVLGIGAGWQINEHLAYGIDLEEPATRVSRFEEAIQVVRVVADRGPHRRSTATYYTITDAPIDPKPVQSPLPILVGTSSPRMLRITATHADEWNTWGAPETGRWRTSRSSTLPVNRSNATRRRCARATQALVFMSDDADLVDEDPAGDMADRARSSDRSTRSSTRSAGYVELGFDEFIVPDFTLGGRRSQRTPRRPTAELRLRGARANSPDRVQVVGAQFVGAAGETAASRVELRVHGLGDGVGQEALRLAARRGRPA